MCDSIISTHTKKFLSFCLNKKRDGDDESDGEDDDYDSDDLENEETLADLAEGTVNEKAHTTRLSHKTTGAPKESAPEPTLGEEDMERVDGDDDDGTMICSASEIRYIGYYDGDRRFECVEELKEQIRSGKIPKELIWVEYERNDEVHHALWTGLVIDKKRQYMRGYIAKAGRKKPTQKQQAERLAWSILQGAEFWPTNAKKAVEVASEIHAKLLGLGVC